MLRASLPLDLLSELTCWTAGDKEKRARMIIHGICTMLQPVSEETEFSIRTIT